MFKRAMFLALIVLMLAVPAMAANPHFLYANADVGATTVTVTFKEAGLGNGDVLIEASSLATSEYGCVNGGGKRPSDPKKTQVTETVTASAIFSPKNGQLTGSLTLYAPGPGDFTCPKGQKVTFFGATFGPVTVTDLTNGVSILAD